MIVIRRSDQFAIHIEFDDQGALALLKALQDGSAGSPGTVSIEFDRGVTKKKRFADTTTMRLVVGQGDDEIAELKETVELKLEPKTRNILRERLERCIAAKDFFPPELGEFFVSGRDVRNDVYCILK